MFFDPEHMLRIRGSQQRAVAIKVSPAVVALDANNPIWVPLIVTARGDAADYTIRMLVCRKWSTERNDRWIAAVRPSWVATCPLVSNLTANVAASPRKHWHRRRHIDRRLPRHVSCRRDLRDCGGGKSSDQCGR